MSEQGLEYRSIINELKVLIIKKLIENYTSKGIPISEESAEAAVTRILGLPPRGIGSNGFRNYIEYFENGSVYDPDMINANLVSMLYDLDVLFGEANNIEAYYIKTKDYVETTANNIERILSESMSRILDYKDIDIGSVTYTDIIHKTFNKRDNSFDGDSKLNIDLYAENLKLPEEHKVTFVEQGKSTFRYELLSRGIEIVEEGDIENLHNISIINPWYVSMVSGTLPVNDKFYDYDYSQTPGILLVLYVDFTTLSNITQVRLKPFTNTDVEVLDIFYNINKNADSKTYGWTKIDITNGKQNNNLFAYEYNFDRTTLRTLAVVLRIKTGTIEEKQQNIIPDNKSITNVIKDMLVLVPEDASPLEPMGTTSDIEELKKDPFGVRLKMALDNYNQRNIYEPGKRYDFVIGLTSLEVNQIKYAQNGRYESPNIMADGNIMGVQIEDEIVFPFVSGDIPACVVNYSIGMGQYERPIANPDNNNKILEGVIIYIENNYKYIQTRFIPKYPEEVIVYYNNREIDHSEIVNLGQGKYRLNSIDIRTLDACGVYYEPIDVMNNKLYLPENINVPSEIGLPHLIKANLIDIVGDPFIYLFGVNETLVSGERFYNPDFSRFHVLNEDDTETVTYNDKEYLVVQKSPTSGDFLYGENYLYNPVLPDEMINNNSKGFIPYEYYDRTERELYAAVFDINPTLVSKVGDLFTYSVPEPYKKGQLMVFRMDTGLVYNITHWADNNMQYFSFVDSNEGNYLHNSPDSEEEKLKVSYSPIRRDTIIQSNISLPIFEETFNKIPGNKTIKLNRYPYTDIYIVANERDFSYSNGVFTYRRNSAVTYEPIQVFINKRKIINVTNYRDVDQNTIMSDPIDPSDIRFYIIGNELKFNTTMLNVDVTIRYYTLTDNIRLYLDMYRIDNARQYVTPEVFNTTLLVDVRKT